MFDVVVVVVFEKVYVEGVHHYNMEFFFDFVVQLVFWVIIFIVKT